MSRILMVKVMKDFSGNFNLLIYLLIFLIIVSYSMFAFNFAANKNVCIHLPVFYLLELAAMINLC